MTLKVVKDVQQFMVTAEQEILAGPTFPDQDTINLRVALIEEEVKETMDAIRDRDMVEVADGLADSIVVIVGTALAFGIDLTAVWNEVHRSNMAKFPICNDCNGAGERIIMLERKPPVPQAVSCEPCSGKGRVVIRRADGKILKPESWTPPDIAGILDE